MKLDVLKEQTKRAWYAEAKDCREFNNIISQLIGMVLRSDRAACIRQIRRPGIQGHAEDMASNRRQTIRR